MQSGLVLHALQRLGVEIGEADVEFEILDSPLDLLAGQRKHRHRDAGKAAR